MTQGHDWTLGQTLDMPGVMNVDLFCVILCFCVKY